MAMTPRPVLRCFVPHDKTSTGFDPSERDNLPRLRAATGSPNERLPNLIEQATKISSTVICDL
jgi:hypothetical protein